MPAAAGTGMPLRLNIVYPIGFFKGSEDVYSKFLTQGEKYQIESYTAPENGKLYMNVNAVAKATSSGTKEAKLASIFRFDQIDSEGSGIRTEVQLDTEAELSSSNIGFYKKIDGDEHRVLVEYGYASRNSEGIRRVPLLSELTTDLSGQKFKGKPLKIGYRVNSSDYSAVVEADLNKKWQLNVGANVAGATVGGKVYDDGKGVSFDVGVGGKTDAVQGYAKFAMAGGDKTATVLVHPRLDTSSTFGLSFVAKAVLDVAKMNYKEAGITAAGALPGLKGFDWKTNLTIKGGKLSVSKALTTKLPGKWTLGAGFAFGDPTALNLKDVKFGLRLSQGSTPPPL